MRTKKAQKHSKTETIDPTHPDIAAAKAAALDEAMEDDRIPDQLLVLFKEGIFVCPGSFARYDGLRSVQTLNAEKTEGMFFHLQFESEVTASAAYELLAQHDVLKFVQYNYAPFAGVAYKKAKRRLSANSASEVKRGEVTSKHRTIIIDGTPMAVSVCRDTVRSIDGVTLPPEKDVLRTQARKSRGRAC